MTETNNKSYGFWGTMRLEGEEMAEQAWPLASKAIAESTGENAESVQAFLDSRYGRHFADDVHNGLFQGKNLNESINAATNRWMGWKLSKADRRAHGVPKGFDAPYLTTMVILCAFEDEMA